MKLKVLSSTFKAALFCGVAIANPLAAQDEGFADDLTLDPSTNVDRYFPLDDVDNVQRTASHNNGVLTLTAEATEVNDYRNRLFLMEPTDYFESTFSISSASELGEAGRVRGQMEMSLYNVFANGGIDNRLGNVETFMNAELRPDGFAEFEYCLVRQDGSEGENEAGLLPDDRFCDVLPLRIEFDTPIRAAIDFDRDAGTVTYRANEFVSVVSLDGPFFAHGDPYAGIAASPGDLATVVLDIDEIRNSRTILTDTEVNSGVTEPTSFPPAQTEAVMVDSTISFPFTQTTPVDFIDDFSQSTPLLVFDPNREGTEAGIAFLDGALQIEATKTDPDDCCGDSRLRIQEKTDFIAARVSLSSDSRIPVEDDARAVIRIDGTWYNDTQDGGFDDRGGDVFVQMRIRARGDGRREVSFCLDRETGNGDGEGVNVVDGDNCGRFSTIPEFDTQYDMSVTLDRSAATMTFSFNDETRVIGLGRPVFEAQRSQKAITVQHQGSSGRAVGRIHSLTTNSGTIDIAADELLLGPYRPTYATQYAGRDVTVIDGRLRFDVDSEFGENNQPRFVTRNPSDFVAATVEISSESQLDSGKMRIGVAGFMYNDIMDGGVGDNSSEGAVFGTVNQVATADGENYFEYCAWRSNNTNFSDETEILGSDSETCPRFSTVPVLDTPARISVSFDQSRGLLTYTVGEETIEHAITTGFFRSHTYFNGIRVNSDGGSRLIAFADDLAFAADPIPLADSASVVGLVAPNLIADESDLTLVDESPYTGVACVDNDGDGWGWQNPDGAPGRSCQIPIIDTMPDDSVYFGVACIDNDGDGWGWQQLAGFPGRSCQL